MSLQQTTKSDILNNDAISFLTLLTRTFKPVLDKLLNNRILIQKNIDNGNFPNFINETKNIRESEWIVSPLPDELQLRTVEITGPAERKMMINALNSDADCFMCDVEDSLSPTWDNIINSQINFYDYVHQKIAYYNPEKNKHYYINDYNNTPVLFVRPRGLHMVEKNLLIDNEPIPASFFDFGLYFFHNAKQLLSNNTGPYFYLPKLEHYLEARLWNDIFNFSQDYFKIPRGTIKATVLVEHISLAFQMDEVLFELRNHSAGLNCGRWDYIFSFIKKFKNFPNFCLPDRSLVTMNTHFMDSYVKLLTKTCHRRKVHAMGGMAAQVPVKNNPDLNNKNLEKVYSDKKKEAENGMDGTWVAHPGLIKTARLSFIDNRVVKSTNQISYVPDVNISAKDLLTIPTGEITHEGIIENINALVLYINSWLNGRGAVAISHKMEDAATAEISRLQLWQWVKHKKRIDTGKLITLDYISDLTYEISSFNKVNELFLNMLEKDVPDEFLTIELYDLLN